MNCLHYFRTENKLESHGKVKYSISFSMSTISSFRSIKNKHDVHRGKYCMKNFMIP